MLDNPWAPWGGRVDNEEFTGAARLSEDESHDLAPLRSAESLMKMLKVEDVYLIAL
jgi:hypothetical protein